MLVVCISTTRTENFCWKGKEMKIFNLIIISRNKYLNDLTEGFNAGWNGCEKIQNKAALTVINPVIHSLKELRKNTWDVERVDRDINWLKDNFEKHD